MNIKKTLVPILLLALPGYAAAQTTSEKDSAYIDQVEKDSKPYKVLHAEPLYIDLIRDLGARKGEKEWNVGLGLTDNLKFDSYQTLIEYEWAPMDRVGLEVELPFTYYASVNGTDKDLVPAHHLHSVKVATQWSFFVNEAMATSMALGYINEFELSDFAQFGNPVFRGNVYNPFLVVAKRWGTNFHSLIYAGPRVEHMFANHEIHASFEWNSSFHYMIPGTRNFLGVEFNKSQKETDFDMTIRPQMRLGIADNLLVGIVAGIPIKRENERISSFVRLIWEPGHHKK